MMLWKPVDATEKSEERRKKLEEDVKAFLEKGGTIKKYGIIVRTEDQGEYNGRVANRGNHKNRNMKNKE